MTPLQTTQTPVIKYRYLTIDKIFRPITQGQYNRLAKLCISISTQLVRVDEKTSICKWAVAFKSPSDRFSKEEAKLALAINELDGGNNGTFVLLNNEYTHNEIVSKILMYLAVNDAELSSSYRSLVRALLSLGDYGEFLTEF